MTEPKNSILKQYAALFELDNVELTFEPDALRAIAQKALDQKTGARGLRGVIETILTPLMFSIPSDPAVSKVIITLGSVDGTSLPILERRDADAVSGGSRKSQSSAGDKKRIG